MSKLLLLLGLCLGAVRATAQADWFFQYGVAWNLSTPLDRNFVSGTSGAGGHFELLVKPWKKSLMAGLQIDWSTYDTYTPTATYLFDGGNSALTTDYYAYQYNLPLLATVQRYFGKGERLFPWARLAAGTQYSLQQLYYGVFMEEHRSWGFSGKGEAGAALAFSRNIPLLLSLSAGISYATNGAAEFGDSDWLSWNVQLGLVLRQF
jgi:hypothetical protein